MSLESFNISKQKVSYMIPSKFQDVNIRIFTKSLDKMRAVQKAFRRYLGHITRTDLHSNPTVPVPEDYQKVVSASLKRCRSSQSLSPASTH